MIHRAIMILVAMAIGMAVISAIPSTAVSHATGGDQKACALNVAVTHTGNSVSAKNNNSNPCGRFYWAWMIVKLPTGQKQDNSRGVLSGTTTATDPGAIENCEGGWKWSDSSGVVHVHIRYGGPC